MCGRFTLMLDAEDLQEEFGLAEVPTDFRPRYNIAPSQAVLVLADSTGRRAEWMRWGLVPSWAKDVSIGYKLINARSETVMEKPSFRSAFRSRRCLIFADGFYEWQKSAGKGPSQPFHFTLAGGKLCAFAGLWETWRPPEGEEPLRSCTILTTAANELVAPVHERMPVILNREAAVNWLAASDPSALMGLLKPFPAENMRASAVSRRVNSPDADGPELVTPVRGEER